ncbi:MAG: STAS domain-containing protein [Actinomycetota bacterium]
MTTTRDGPEIQRDGDWLIVAWPTEIDMANAEALQGETLDGVRNTDSGVVVDLTGVTYFDSAGIRSLIAIKRLLAERQQRFLVVVPAESLLNRVLDISGIPGIVPLYLSMEDARRAWNA